MGKMKLFTLLLGVALTRVATSTPNLDNDVSEENAPIASQENNVQARRVEVPEVVLQLKYNRGELNRIYLTQFRKDTKLWVPSVSTRNNLCTDLCHAGLGGEACGSACTQLIPVGLQMALREANQTSAQYGHPRYAVCPSLCDNQLGQPLCNCMSREVNQSVNWTTVCNAFCLDGYSLNGCPTCESVTTDPTPELTSTRILSTYEGWAAWCNVQCRQGQGGAACNCDRAAL